MAANIIYDGFANLEGGVNGGISPSLLQQNQVTAACNLTFRGAFATTRPPWESLILTFENSGTESNFAGKFQGACFYSSTFGTSGFVIARGGRLFLITIGASNTISEITPKTIVITTEAFTVPAIGVNVNVGLSTETPLTIGSTVHVDSGSYIVSAKYTNGATLNYQGGAANATVISGTSVLTSADALIIDYYTFPASLDFVHLFQAENYVIAMAAPNKTIIYDGTTARTATIGELQPGNLGAYGWGRIWQTLQDQRAFIAGDLIYSSSGTAALGYRDAILKVTENDFLAEGGNFSVPFNSGGITAMQFLATQDTSLGMGVLMVGTSNAIFSVNAPIDRTTWKNLQYPIQTISLLDYGPLGPRSACPVNGDWWFRSVDGIRSFVVARRDFDMWGNTPMSREMSPVLNLDTKSLLYYGSALLFDNRMYMTASPYRTTSGIAHRGLVVMNFDLISNLRGKSAPAWEGVCSGLNILQLVKGTIGTRERMFAFALNGSAVELWEMHSADDGLYYDTINTSSGGSQTITTSAIESWMETRSMNWQSSFTPKMLNMAELFVDEIVDNVSITVKFRPDQYPSWIDWATIDLCATVSQCAPPSQSGPTCEIWTASNKQYAAHIKLPQPPETCNTIEGTRVNTGHEFQFRFEITGHCRIRQFRAQAIAQLDDSEGSCPTAPTCSKFQSCEPEWFDYDIHA